MKKAVLVLTSLILLLLLCSCNILPFPNDRNSSEDTVSEISAASLTSESKGSSSDQNSYNNEPNEFENSAVLSSDASESKETSLKSADSSNDSVNGGVSSDDSASSSEPLSWNGVYLFGQPETGEILIVQGVSAGAVYGTYIFEYASGGYGSREFNWMLDPSNPNRASELFQNGVDYNYFNLLEDRILVDYPAGWWADRDYYYICPVEREDLYPDHPFFKQEKSSIPDSVTHTPFYGIWIAASGDYDEVKAYADEMRERGFNAGVYITTDWSNLNTVRWYVVSAGEYPSEEAAEADLFNVRDAGWTDAYIKYTGEWKG